jgi:hypothetical protein
MADPSKTLIRGLVRLSLAVLPQSAGVAVGHRLRAHDELRRARKADLIVLSHAKSGRTWLRVMLSRLFQVRYGLPASELMEFDAWHRHNPAVPKILYTHGHYLGGFFDREGSGGEGSRKKIVFLVRHPCDIAVSQYFHFAKRTKEYKRKLHEVDSDREVDMFDFVRSGPMGLPEIIEYLNAWERRLSGREGVLRITYEEMRARPNEFLKRISTFLDLGFEDHEIAEAVAFGRFENLKEMERTNFFRNSRLSPGDPDDPDSFKVRRAKVGGYRDYFDEMQLGRLEELVRERLSVSLGYGGGSNPPEDVEQPC